VSATRNTSTSRIRELRVVPENAIAVTPVSSLSTRAVARTPTSLQSTAVRANARWWAGAGATATGSAST
jgi:hypothetical protein